MKDEKEIFSILVNMKPTFEDAQIARDAIIKIIQSREKAAKVEVLEKANSMCRDFWSVATIEDRIDSMLSELKGEQP